MNRTTPMQRLLIAMANASLPLPVPKVGKNDLVPPVVPEYPKDDELLTLALDEGARQAEAIVDGLDVPPRYRRKKFWNVGKTEAEHKKLKAKRKAERLARRKNRR